MYKILIGILIFSAAGCSTASDNANVSTVQTANVNSKFSTTNTITVTAPAIPESQLADTAPGSRTFIDGSQIVGKDIVPGTYRTRAGTGNCRWTRRSGLSGSPGEIVATGFTKGPAIVTIEADDKGFESVGCGQWTSDLKAITGSPTAPFGDGSYFVGTDIVPGTWKAQDPQNCQWIRVKGFTGEAEDVIGTAERSGIVTIQKTDKGFIASSCGSWTLQKGD
jgi:hypothetical protein